MKRIVWFLIVGVLVVGAIALGMYVLQPAPPAPAPIVPVPKTEVVGKSVQGRDIVAYTYGTGATNLLFVGGIHGGYEWNSVLLAYMFMDYLKDNPTAVPESVRVSVIPNANPDGVYKVVGKEGRFTAADVTADAVLAASGRFNANNIDINRNFDCKWKPQSTWRSEVVGAGSAPFSEPEAQAIRTFVLQHHPSAVVFWHSQANAVYASECESGVLPKTIAVMSAYSRASGYPAVESFDAYEVTGDAEGWLASIGIPAVTVELKTHEAIEWEKNLAGVKALFTLYSQ